MGPIPEGSIADAEYYLKLLRDTQSRMSFLDSFLQDQKATPWTMRADPATTNVATSRAKVHLPTQEYMAGETNTPKWEPAKDLSKLAKERQMLANTEAIQRAAAALHSPAWNLPNTVPPGPGGVRPNPVMPGPGLMSRTAPMLMGADLLMHSTPLNQGEDEKLRQIYPPYMNPNAVPPQMRNVWSLFQ